MTETQHLPEPRTARRYWSSLGLVPFYQHCHHWRTFLARQVARHRPRSVLEFGCNVGQNLAEVRRLLPDAALYGVDVNAEAVTHGVRTLQLDLMVGGEEVVAGMDAHSIDVVFTSSTLDHVPEIEPAFAALARVARWAVVLLEPYAGCEGRVDVPEAPRVAGGPGEPLTAVPFTYSWDYLRLSRMLGSGWQWTWTPYPLSGENLGPHYWLIDGRRCQAGGDSEREATVRATGEALTPAAFTPRFR